MDAVFDYTIPFQHALAVHFPLVILLLAAGAASVYGVRGTAAWRHGLLWLLGLGVVTAFWARQTGPALLESVEGTPIVELLIEPHTTGALWTVVLSALAFALTTTGSLWIRRQRASPATTTPDGAAAHEPLVLRVLVMLTTVLAAAAVAWTGHVGAVMVWGVAG